MRSIQITVANLERLRAWGESRGMNMAPTARRLGQHRVEIEVDDEVFAHLEALDPDPDRALWILFTTGVGRA